MDECGVCGGAGIPEGQCDCDGNVLDECGVCAGPGAIYECGCSDIPEGDCDCDGTQLDVIGFCGGSCLADFNGDGECDWDTTSYWLSVETVTTHSGGELDGMTTYRLYMNLKNENDYLASCAGWSQNPLIFTSSTGTWYNNAFNTTWSAAGFNPAFVAVFPDMAYDSFLTIGAEDALTPGAQQPSTIWGDNDASAQFTGPLPGMNIVVDDETGGAWYTPFPGIEQAGSHVAFAGSNLKVLVAQFTTAGTISGQFQVQVFVNGDQGQEYRRLHAYSSENQPGQDE